MQAIKLEQPRLRWVHLHTDAPDIDEAAEVRLGLQQMPKTLPCRYFYDDRGSMLFEQICDLPEYYPTRTEQGILEACALEIAHLTGNCELVELGSGSSRKTRLLLEAYGQLQGQVHYCPIDVSAGILKTTALELLECYPNLNLCGLAGTYEQALAQLPAAPVENRLLIFLGSTLGNLDASACATFLNQVQAALNPGEYFLLGVDLQKSIPVLEAAYNDAQGVTAAFNLNILNHLNHRFDGNFQPNHFTHRAFYNSKENQIEMHLESLTDQTVNLLAIATTINFKRGERVRTEISRKFHLPTLTKILRIHQLNLLQTWTDPKEWFSLILCQRQ